MAFEKVTPKSDFLMLEAGQEVVGTYLMKTPSEKYQDQSNYILDINGVQKKLMGCANLDSLFSQVKEGTVVKVVFKGKEKTKKGVEFNKYEVFQDKK